MSHSKDSKTEKILNFLEEVREKFLANDDLMNEEMKLTIKEIKERTIFD